MTVDLPEGWTACALGEINRFSSATIEPTRFGAEVFELYSVPSFPSGRPESTMGSEIGSMKQVVLPGDVLVCKINPRINRVWQVRPAGDYRQIGSSEWIVVRAPGLVPSYLVYYFRSPAFRKLITEGVSGVGGSLTRAHPKQVATFPILVAPYNEQMRIADKLDAVLARVDACRERLDRVPIVLERFRQAVLAAATSGRLTEDWRADNDHEISDWSETTVGEISEVFLGRQRSPENHRGPYMRRYVRAANVTWNGWNFSDIKEMNFSPRDFERYRLQVGDILLNEGSGSADEVGKPAVWNGEVEDCCFQNTLICVRPRDESSKYLYFLFLHAARSRAFSTETRGVNIFHIGKERLSAFEISLPPLAEQHEIVRRIETLFGYADRLEARYHAARTQLERLTPALLAKAFRGELVPQDPSDEPAALLLDRIRQERVSADIQMGRARRISGRERRATKEKKMTRPGDIVEALRAAAGKELSSVELLAAAGYPADADSESIEALFVAIRDALGKKEIVRTRRQNMDWFALAER